MYVYMYVCTCILKQNVNILNYNCTWTISNYIFYPQDMHFENSIRLLVPHMPIPSPVVRYYNSILYIYIPGPLLLFIEIQYRHKLICHLHNAARFVRIIDLFFYATNKEEICNALPNHLHNFGTFAVVSLDRPHHRTSSQGQCT